MAERPEVADHYGAHYRDFASDVYAEVRRAAFGQDVGQNSWLRVDGLDRFVSRLELRSTARLLDVGCGSGGPTLSTVPSPPVGELDSRLVAVRREEPTCTHA